MKFAIAFTLLAASVLPAADWPTDGGNPQRTGFQPDETVLNKDNVKDLQLVWKLQLDNKPRELHSLFPALLTGQLRTSSGEKEMAIVAGISDNLYGIDAAAGTLLWQKHFPYTSPNPLSGYTNTLCPGGLTATPVLGPVNEQGGRTVYVISWDGMLHQINASDGEETATPRTFLPANGKPYALNLVNGFLYTTTAQSCGGNLNAIYALEMNNPDAKTVFFEPGGRGGLWGRTGAAIGSDGTVYAPTGDGPFDPEHHMLSEALVAATGKTLQLKDYYGAPNALFLWKRDLDMNVTPAVFDYQGRELLVTSSKECRAFLLDTKSLGGVDHRTALYRSPLVCNEDVNFAAAGVWGSVASWQDKDGTRWILMPFWGPKHPDFHVSVSYGEVTHGAVVAFKVEDKDGHTILTPAWMSRDMNQAEPPIVANGVVYTYGSGVNNVQSTPNEGLAANNSPVRIKKSGHAIIYALDARTGRELWSSGDRINSFAHFSGLSIANGHLYLGTYDSNLYSFGLPSHQVASR